MQQGKIPKVQRRPDWLKVRLPAGDTYTEINRLLNSSRLNTVCKEARCPNIGECFNQRTATFLILGDVCTRGCRFCNVTKGTTKPVDYEEPERVAAAAREMGLRHVVVTSVTRDDLQDGGAGIYSKTISLIRKFNPESTIEVLIPDFKGSVESLNIVVSEMPDVINHNIETVPRLYKLVRPGAVYEQSLYILEHVKKTRPEIMTKSGLMAGIGEEFDEVVEVMKDLRRAGCEILTIGQYLSPGKRHLPVQRYYHPGEFADLKKKGLELGFRYVESGPLVRSSYHAVNHFQGAAEEAGLTNPGKSFNFLHLQ
ncbi:MAG: lipoyl synthase [Nitrospira sp.]|nr:lipoyl synthase [Nitrospira sp.]